ncbi:MAG: flagellar brake protein [Gallionellaceae bacterium]
MSLFLIKKSEIRIGEPLPWAMYDEDYKLLMPQGSIIRDNEQLNSLLASGACREVTRKKPKDKESDLSQKNSSGGEEKTPEEGKERFTFNDMKLKVDDKLQLEPPVHLGNDRFLVKVLGFIRGISLMVSAPVAPNGSRLQLLENESVVMRSFAGQNAFGFGCTILRSCKIPAEYLHLSFPSNIQGIMIRKAPRIKTRIIANVQIRTSLGGDLSVPSLITNISSNGAALETKEYLGDKGDNIQLTFRVNLHKVDALLSVKGMICAVLTNKAGTTASPDLMRYGIEFKDMLPNDSVILQSMIYQYMIESPHLLM